MIVSVPHAVNHFSRGKIKYAELLTGGIASYLYRQTSCHLICTTRYKHVDANRDTVDACEYKQRLLEYIPNNNIKALIDLHGMKVNQDYAIELGTGGYGDPTLMGYNDIAYSIEEILKSSLGKYLIEDDKQIVRNVKFAARGENTITNFISNQLNIPCIQFEIGGEYRDINNPERLEALITGLQSIIEVLAYLNLDLGRR